VTAHHHAGASRRWATGATLVYGPIATELVAMSPHPVSGRTVLDAGAGTGAISSALTALRAHPVATDPFDRHAGLEGACQACGVPKVCCACELRRCAKVSP
jgi:predicted RNA methylase